MANDLQLSPVPLLHVFATFDCGGPQVRTVEIMRALGDEFAHTIVAADGRTGAATRTPTAIPIERLKRPASAWRQLRDLVAIARRSEPALVLTYNWGAILGCVAARLVGVPFVHHEEVVPPEERTANLRRRDWLRRVVLPRAAAIVVPSAKMAARAHERWRIAPARIERIDNGVDLAGRSPRTHRSGGGTPPVVGCVAHARIEKNWPRLLRSFAGLRTQHARLLLVGEGPERESAEHFAGELGLAPRVIFAGVVDDPRSCYDAMDVFALASDDEQMPLALLEAMAHGLPIVATDVGDISTMVPEEQRRFVVPLHGDAHCSMAAAIDELLADATLRTRLGAANRRHVERSFDLRGIAAQYAALYRRHARVPARREACA